jgi:hypothetical protein
LRRIETMIRKNSAMILVMAVAMLVMPSALAAGQSGLASARQATAAFHDVGKAESAGYGSTIDILGCFENPGVGGMGLHYVDFSLVDGVVDATQPEALVYEMRSDGKLKLVALEYIVPDELVDPANPPMLFGQHLHKHSVLPLWVLHAWIWAPNPLGMFADWNPRVGMCPEGVPVFGS